MPIRRATLWAAVLAVAVAGLLWWAAGQDELPENPATSPPPPANPDPTSLAEPEEPQSPAASAAASTQALASQEGPYPSEQRVAAVYDRVQASVVNIKTQVVTQSFFGRQQQEGTGSGFVYDRQGHIVTNNHVIQGASDISVTFPDGTIAEATVVGTDPLNDLAVLRVQGVPSEELPPVTMGNSEAVRPGHLAIAVGNPFGFERTITTGVVSALNRTLERQNGRPIFGLIQTDAAINRGNSGGPLLNSRGEVIGITTAIFSPSGGSVGIGFAIPSNTVRQEVPVLIERGRYPHPWLGIAGYPLTPEIARLLQEAGVELGVEQGVVVAEVVPDGPAAQAGLQGGAREVVIGNSRFIVGGDIITAIDGKAVTGMEGLIRYLETETEVGQVVTLTIVRDGQERTIEVTLGERPPGQ